METIEKSEGENGVNFFSYKIDGKEAARMLVIITPGVLKAGHTGVDLSQRRKGLGTKLVDAMVQFARENNLKVLPECGFVSMLFNKYPERYGDIRAAR
jgi:uncharacterized protein